MEMTSEVKMPVVAYLVGGLRSGEPSLCFEDERGDYGSEDETPDFDALVLQSDALAAIEAARVEAENLREELARTERNRDMWKEQCAQQARQLESLHMSLAANIRVAEHMEAAAASMSPDLAAGGREGVR